MDMANAEFEATAEQYRRLARKSINHADLRRYLKTVFKVQDDQEGSTRLKNIMEEVVGLAEAGRGNALPSVSGTLWTAYNGVSEWLGYQRGSSENRLNSLWFGSGASLNHFALETALAMAV
jgi:Domain of unknown function (DUF932)